MTLPRALLRLYHYPANALAWAVFGIVGVGLNLACMPLLLARDRARRGHAVRGAIRRLFAAWCAGLHAMRLVYVRFDGFTPEAMAGPAVYIANHPGLLDATFILSRLPDTICIFKPSLMRNPAIGPAALMAGYAVGEHGVDLIREVAQRVADGRSVLIFPEGTRTAPGVAINPLHAGFALIAQRAGAPVRVIVIRAPRDLVPKGGHWWRPPAVCPAPVAIELLGEITPQSGESAAQLTARGSRQLSSALAAK